MDYFEHLAERLAHKEDFVPGILGRKDKVRELARIVGVRTPHVYYHGPLDGLPEELPEEFVLKPDFASTSIGVQLLGKLEGGTFRDLVKGDTVTRESVLEQCEIVARKYFDDSSTRASFILEELLTGLDGESPPADVRCYTFQGEIGMVLMEHHIAGPAHAMYFDGNFHPFVDLEHRYGIAPGMEQHEIIEHAVTPPNATEILNVARRISVAVPSAFCRVDLYNTPHGVYLGEITFYPGTFYYKNRKIMHQIEADRLGRLWSQAAERLTGSHLPQ